MNTEKYLNQLVAEYLSECDIVEISAKTYLRILNVFIKYLTINAKDVKNPTKADIILFKSYLFRTGKTILTIDSYLKVISLFFRYLESKGYYSDISKGTHHRKRYYGYRKGYLSKDQVIKLLKSLPNVSIIDKRNTAIIQLMLRNGLRCIEVSRLAIEDIISDSTGYALKIQRKGHLTKDQIIGISQKVYDPIEIYLTERGTFKGNEPLFINHQSKNNISKGLTAITISRIVMNELNHQGLGSKQVTAHSLRHTCAITALKSGVDIYDVSKMLGHTNIATTQIYISAIESETLRINPASIALDKVY